MVLLPNTTTSHAITYTNSNALKYDNYNFGKNIHRIAGVSPDISHKENSLNRIGYLVTKNTFRKRQSIR